MDGDSDGSPAGTPAKVLANQAVSALTAGIRALVYQLQALYLRTPVKLFRPLRFDYLAYVRQLANKYTGMLDKPYRFRTHLSLGILMLVYKEEGWRFIPEKVLPPLVANLATGLILYVTYLSALEHFDPRTRRANMVYSPVDTWRAGFLAGMAQSLAAAPIDAIYTRLLALELLLGKHENLWVYGLNKLKEVGLVGVFAGYLFLFVKELFGFAFYFSTFEAVKTHGYRMAYSLTKWWRKLKTNAKHTLPYIFGEVEKIDPQIAYIENTRSARVLKGLFILLAGALAAFSLLAIQYPITKVQKLHLLRLEALDIYNRNQMNRPFFHLYYNSYVDTFKQVAKMQAKLKLTWFQFMYKGFARNALGTVPATSIGLLVFEIMRTKLATTLDEDDVLGA